MNNYAILQIFIISRFLHLNNIKSVNSLYNPVHALIMNVTVLETEFPEYFCWLYLFIYIFFCLRFTPLFTTLLVYRLQNQGEKIVLVSSFFSPQGLGINKRVVKTLVPTSYILQLFIQVNKIQIQTGVTKMNQIFKKLWTVSLGSFVSYRDCLKGRQQCFKIKWVSTANTRSFK